MKFEIKSGDHGSSARAGNIITGHGEIPTPIFMPVGTAGTVKGIMMRDLEEEIDGHDAGKESAEIDRRIPVHLSPGKPLAPGIQIPSGGEADRDPDGYGETHPAAEE